jgi:hypothetical protein
MSSTGWIILLIVNIPVYFGLGWVFFKTLDDFWEAIKFWLTPDLISLFKGEYWTDRWSELKLGLWIVSCILCVIGEAHLIGKFFG